MTQAADSTSPASARIQAALLEYFDAPGKFPLGSRQPEVLFNAIYEVLQLAAGRTPNNYGPAGQGLREAAAFFIGAALLYPGADHYALLGLPPATEPVRLKERYRLLMRLIHPDFADSVRGNWPNDSAMRVNRAYEVLSSPVLRREYDEQLANTGLHQRSAATHVGRRATTASKRMARAPRRRISKSMAWSCIALFSLLAVAMLLPHRDPVHIVQKPKPATPAFSKTGLVPLRMPGPSPQALHSDDAPVAEALERPAFPAPAPAALFKPVEAPPQRALPIDAAPPSGPAPVPPPSASIAVAPPIARPLEMPAVGGDTRIANVPQPSTVQSVMPSAMAVPLEAPAAPLRVAAIRSRSAPTMSEAQPLLNQLLQSLESGNPERLLHMLEAEARQSASAQTLSRHYQRLVGRSRPVTLSQAEFKGEPKDDVLVVTGNLRLQIGESTIGSLGEKLMVRAEFESRGGRVTLTRLSGVTE